MQLLLASASPARKDLLTWLGIPFAVMNTDIDEAIFPDEEASEVVVRLAAQKAETAATLIIGAKNKIFDLTNTEEVEARKKYRDSEAIEGVVIIGADTTIAVGDTILNKPTDRADAERMIRLLAGNTHIVYSGVCVIDVDSEERFIEYDETAVKIRAMSEDEIQKYLDTNEWEGKAGGYQIQKCMKQYVQDIQGSFTSIVGIPLLLVEEMLERVGLAVEVNVRETIEGKTGYTS